jgi:Zn-dependent M28 family amino/carboxypeptidase
VIPVRSPTAAERSPSLSGRSQSSPVSRRLSHQPHSHSDHWPFLQTGIPALQLHSRRSDGSGAWERGYTHTRDKIDPRDLRTHAVLATLVIRRLAAEPPATRSTARVRDALWNTGAEPGMRATGAWPDN